MQRTECPHESVQLAIKLTQNSAAVGKECEVVCECREPGNHFSGHRECRHLVGNLLFRVRNYGKNAAPHLFKCRSFRFGQRRDISVDIGGTHGFPTPLKYETLLPVFSEKCVYCHLQHRNVIVGWESVGDLDGGFAPVGVNVLLHNQPVRDAVRGDKGVLVRPLIQSRLIGPVRFIEREAKVDFLACFFSQRVSIRRVSSGKTVGLPDQRRNTVLVDENGTEVQVRH